MRDSQVIHKLLQVIFAENKEPARRGREQPGGCDRPMRGGDAVIGKKDRKKRKANKSERRMPRLPEAKKDVVSCEKVRGSANRS